VTEATAGTDTAPGGEEERRIGVGEIFAIQPGLARLMPEIGARMWKCWYAAEAGNWRLAEWQLKELKKLIRVCVFTRPKYTEDLDAYVRDDLGPLTAAITDQDFAAFDAAYRTAVDRANWYHDKWNKDYIVWRCPDTPPPDLDLRPR
jgi:hypothetical protein